MRHSLFWVVTQPTLAVVYRRFGQPIGPIFQGSSNLGQTLRNNPKGAKTSSTQSQKPEISNTRNSWPPSTTCKLCDKRFATPVSERRSAEYPGRRQNVSDSVTLSVRPAICLYMPVDLTEHRQDPPFNKLHQDYATDGVCYRHC